MRKKRRGIVLTAVLLLSLFWLASAQAQIQSSGWSEPYRLSSEAGRASEGYLVADQYGYVHSFWTESLFEEQRSTIQYARFDGSTWSAANAIYVTNIVIGNISAVVDQQGTLHMAWAEGLNGPVYYSQAPAHDALSAQNWTQPLRINIPAGIVRLRVDSKGIFHILYINRGEVPGVYYVRSADQGGSWSDPIWLDPDIRPNHIPDSLNFELDEQGGLHAAWFYGSLVLSTRPDWVRYTHSLDGGDSWSLPLTIDQSDEATGYNVTNASPRMIVEGQTVHIVWAAGTLPYRHHRYSLDAGQTWSPARQMFGELHGQAFDGLAVDGAGRVHFVGQIRYPMGIYHAFWEQSAWTTPSLSYFIAEQDSPVALSNRIHAHDTFPAVRAGNQLVVIFGDGPADPNRRLFAIHHTLNDVPLLQAVPTPTLLSTPVPAPTVTPLPPTPMPTATEMVLQFDSEPESSEYVLNPALGLQLAIIPTLLLLGGTVLYRYWSKRRL